MHREHVLEEVRRTVREALAWEKADLYLFGSWAKGTPRRSSDIDVAIDPRAPLPPGLLSVLRERLEESRIPYRIEVVDLSDADERFRAAVIRQGIRWSG
jgi:predicted nucleotidyltransferase